MWPVRAERLTDLIPAEELRLLLSKPGEAGSAMTFCESDGEGGYRSIEVDPALERDRPDPFCTFFRHGTINEGPASNGQSRAKFAFEGADRACARCEQKATRHLLTAGEERGAIVRRRCHLGLTDSLVPVEVAGQALGGLVAGRRVAHDEERRRIRKRVGKLGKLTRAEKENFDAREHILIRPHDDSVRERLTKEIDAIPRCSDELDARLAERAALLGSLAAQRFVAFRRHREDLFLQPVLEWPEELPCSQEEVVAELESLLKDSCASLRLSFLAFFARPLGSMDDAGTSPGLLAAPGLNVSVGKSVLELDWSRIPRSMGKPASMGERASSGERGDMSLGLEAVSSLISALVVSSETPKDLKGKLTKSLFLAPVEVSSTWHGAVAFGAPTSSVKPGEDDYRLLFRFARCLVRRYYSFCLAVQHRVLSGRVSVVENQLQTVEEERKKAAIPPGRRFDLRKLLMECREKVLSDAEAKSLAINTRELADRLVVVGERRQIGDMLNQLLSLGIRRSCSDRDEKPLSPLRIVLKRRGRSALLVIEAVGRFMGAGEQRRLFRRARSSGSGERPSVAAGENGADDSQAAAARVDASLTERTDAPGTLRTVQEVVRAHKGRFRVRSERLHRFVSDEHRWMGKTTFEVQLPLPTRVETTAE